MSKTKQPVPETEYQEAIRELVYALELCLECEGLSWEAEREAEILVTRYGKSRAHKKVMA